MTNTSKDARVAELVFGFANSDEAEWHPLPFISAPTGNTDQIVLEWVMGQRFSTRHFFFKMLDKILQDVVNEKQAEGAALLAAWPEVLVFFKSGDYARALLAVEEERDV